MPTSRAIARALARAPKCNCRTCRIRRMDSLSVGIRVPSIDCDGETWNRVNTDPRDDLFFPDALLLAGGGWPGSDRNGGRDQIGMPGRLALEFAFVSDFLREAAGPEHGLASVRDILKEVLVSV